MRELIFLLSADLDIQRAFGFYEDYQDGRGAIFLRHLDVAFTQLRSFPESGPMVQGRYRRLLVPRFPFAIFYTLESRGIIIAGVMDTRQNPATITARLI